MPQSSSSRPRSALLAAVVIVLASLALAACGSSSSGSTASTSASATTSTTGSSGARGSHFAALRECLQKNGIALPKRTPGTRPSGTRGGFLAGGGQQLPKGVTRAKYEAAIKKCGGFPAGGRFGAGASRVSSPAFKAALAKFATCMHENGVNLPTPNTSGKGSIFDTKGLNTASTQFKAAETKCSSVLRSGFRGAPGAGGEAGAPPAGG